jgi:pyruvate formate lyase activating enzyme
MPKATIFNIMKYSIHDGPGIRTTVFMKGCPLRCAWCHNPESIDPKPQAMFFENRCILCGNCEKGLACPTGARETVGYEISAEELMNKLRGDLLFYESSGGGITFSGGEPLMQPEFLLDMLKRCRDEYIHTAVDTSGYSSRETIVEAAKLSKVFLYDVKFASSERHRQFCGVDNRLILDNLRAINGLTKIMIRIPVIPGINDSAEEMTKIADAINGVRIETVHLLPYHNIQSEKYRRLGREYTLGQVPVGETADLPGLTEIFASRGHNVRIGG